MDMGPIKDYLLAVFGLNSTSHTSQETIETPISNVQSKLVQSTDSASATETSSFAATGNKLAKSEDCSSCRITGVSVFLLGSAFVFYYSFKSAKQLQGVRRALAYGQGISFGSLLIILAASRAFDLGVFDSTKHDQLMKDRLVEELNDIEQLKDKWKKYYIENFKKG